MDIQVILVFILALLTVNLVIVGVYVVLVLREVRETLKKSNMVLDNISSLSSSIGNPLTTLVGIASAAMQSMKTVRSIRSLHDSEEDFE